MWQLKTSADGRPVGLTRSAIACRKSAGSLQGGCALIAGCSPRDQTINRTDDVGRSMGRGADQARDFAGVAVNQLPGAPGRSRGVRQRDDQVGGLGVEGEAQV